jgi:hypothetical protein
VISEQHADNLALRLIILLLFVVPEVAVPDLVH